MAVDSTSGVSAVSALLGVRKWVHVQDEEGNIEHGYRQLKFTYDLITPRIIPQDVAEHYSGGILALYRWDTPSGPHKTSPSLC